MNILNYQAFSGCKCLPKLQTLNLHHKPIKIVRKPKRIFFITYSAKRACETRQGRLFDLAEPFFRHVAPHCQAFPFTEFSVMALYLFIGARLVAIVFFIE